MPHGRLVIMSGPSGAGKTSIVKRLLAESPVPLRLSISATTRPPRPLEQDGVDYHFLSLEEFQQRKENGEFLETFEVFGRGYWYGTLSSEVNDCLVRGDWLLLEIDVNGMLQVTRKLPEAISIFVRPQSLEELERRLRGRQTENEETIQRRLKVARQEWKSKDQYDFDVVNDQLDQAVQDICKILQDVAHTKKPLQ